MRLEPVPRSLAVHVGPCNTTQLPCSALAFLSERLIVSARLNRSETVEEIVGVEGCAKW
jgi:hypothetical protein